MFRTSLFQTITVACFLSVNGCRTNTIEPVNKAEIAIMPSRVTMCVRETVQFQAAFADSVERNVVWAVVSGTGTISQDGLYTAPSSIDSDSESVIIEAALETNTLIKETAEILVYSNSIVTFEKAFKHFGGITEKGRAVQQMQDRGFVVVGEVGVKESFSLFRTDAYGDLVWKRTYGRGAGYAIEQTNGGFIVAGSMDTGAVIMKTDDFGQPMWSTVVSPAGTAKAVIQASDGSFVVAGESLAPPDRFGGRHTHILIAKVSATGQLLWSKTYCRGSGNAIVESSSQGFALIGYTQDPFRTYLLRTNSNGDSFWSKNFDVGVEGTGLVETDNNDYVLFGRGFEGFFLLKTDHQGNEIWSKIFDGERNWFASTLNQTADKGFILSGWILSERGSAFDIYLARTDVEGNLLWSRTFGGQRYDLGFIAKQTQDGGFVIAGQFNIVNYLIKTDEMGVVRCLPEIAE